MSVKHKAKALIVHCIDFRFQKLVENDLKMRNLKGQTDRISWPGVSKDLENIKKATKVSINLHDPDEAFIYEHEDCGAYGEDNSLETHRQNANALKDYLEKIKPSIKVTTLFVTFSKVEKL